MSQSSGVRPAKAITRWRHVPVPVRRAVVRTRRWSHHSRPALPRVTVEVFGKVATVVLDDGKVNVLSLRAAQLLIAAHEQIATDRSVAAAVLAGRDGQFCAGFDLDTLTIGGPAREEMFRTGWDALMRFYTLPIPLVVACTGNAVAGGAVLLLAGDRRLGVDGDFVVGFNEASIGLPLPGMLLTIARDRLTADSYDEATTGARMFSPQAALAAGFLHRIVSGAELLSAARAEAERLVRESWREQKSALISARTEVVRHQLPADLELMKRLG